MAVCEPLGTMLLRVGCPVSDSATQDMPEFDAAFFQAIDSFGVFLF